MVRASLSPGGVFATQSTSPLYARKAFWSIHRSVAAEFAHVRPYHLLVPSFGDWGFQLASGEPLDLARAKGRLPSGTRYLSDEVVKGLFVFADDLSDPGAEPSTLDRPVVLTYYLEGWRHWGR